MRCLFYALAQCAWGLPQTLIGLILRVKYRHCPGEWYRGVYVTWHDAAWGGVSLGLFIFSKDKLPEPRRRELMIHEYGHTWQSLFLGPLYLFVVGLPSYVWANSKKFRRMRRERGIRYTSRYPENWASSLGQRFAREKADWS